ncbi:MAG: CoA-binding protein, partial [Pseudomonadota bacterium]|nr:CoA-binding protein [Pseudomonadota bacterium]
MTVLNLEHIFNPSSVALIGASKRPQSIGCVVANNLFNNGFQGPIMPVNPRETAISGVLSYKTIDELPITPDLAVIATPPVTIPGILDNLGKRGTKGAVVITAGFGEMGEEGERLQQQLLDIARPYKMRLVGPNCLGVMVPHIGLNGSFVHVPPLKGDLAFVAQSGAVLSSVVDWATAHGIGFSHLVSLGDMADVDFGDMINYLATDPNTRAILLYVESITHARKFISAARAASRSKPVIAIKVGRSEEGAKAASSHTGALAGSDAVYDAVFRRTGILRVFDLSELFEAVETLAKGTPITGDKLTILTNGGGIGVLATDSLIGEGGRLAELAPSTIEKLNAVLPPVWSHGNPVDIIGDAPGKRYADALDILLEDPGADAILILNCPLAIADSSEAASAVVDVLEKHKNKEAVLTSWLGEVAPKAARALFAEGKIPTYSTPGEAVRGFMHMVRYKRGQETLM